MVSIIIQGKLNNHTLSRLDKFTKYGPVFYSYRDDEVLDSKYLESPVTFVTYPKEVPSHVFNCFNTYYHFNSIRCALEKVETEYVLKMRSDNFFGDLNPFIEAIVNNPDKLIM